VGLPEPPQALVTGLDAVLVTHLHQDHFDDTARRLLPADRPILCQPEDAERLRGDGFADVRPVVDELALGELRIARTGGRHGTGEIAEAMAPVSGYVLRAPGEPVLYIAGDTIFGDDVRDALARHAPDVIVVNASAARFLEGDPIVMDADDVVAVAREAPGAHVVAVHLEAIAHATETRADLRARLQAEGLTDRVAVPEDGSEVPL
jgi:L-ascorbate metabolism protein UlaG (beta-lactamase superfamily)